VPSGCFMALTKQKFQNHPTMEFGKALPEFGILTGQVKIGSCK